MIQLSKAWGKLRGRVEKLKIEPREVYKMSWYEYKRWSLNAHPYANVPTCDEHFIQLHLCGYIHIENDLRLERQLNGAFQDK